MILKTNKPMTIEEKFKKIKLMEAFYVDASVRTGVTSDTIKQRWFNLSKGIKIPEKHLPKIHQSLDHRINYEIEKERLDKKYLVK